MWQENLNLTILFIAGISALSLAFYVYIKGPNRRLNKDFSYLGYASFLWCLSDFFTILTKNIFWVGAAHAFGTCITMTGFFFCCALAEKEVKKTTRFFIIGSTAFFFIISFTPLLVKEIISYQAMGYSAVWGPLFVVWIIYMTIMAPYCFSIPIKVLARVEEKIKVQISYFLFGAGVFAFWALVSCVILPALGFSGFDTIGSSSTIFMITVTSYGIIRNQILGIKSLFFQAFISALTIIIINIVLGALMLLELWFFTNNQPTGAFIVAGFMAIAVFFVGRSIFIKTNDLEKAKINLTDLLEKSEEEGSKTLTIISNFSDGLLILDESDKIFIINPKAEEILNIKAEQSLKKLIWELEEFENAKSMVSLLRENVKDQSKKEKEIELKNGTVLEASIVPLIFKKNNLGKLIILHDITRGKIVEKMKSEFVSLAAHQLRTPLSIIKWSISMLKKGDFGKLNLKQVKIVETTFQSNERLISLVNDLLNITHIEEGRYLYKVAMSDMKEIIKTVINIYNEEINKNKIKIEFTAPDNLPQTMVDSEKIKLVVQNLIDNAIKYSHKGGKMIITLKKDEENIEFKVEDFGIGIPDSNKEKMFTKFSRGDNAIKVNTIGSGLGLFLVKNIVEAHGGKIWFESKENTGTSFYFSLPIKKN